MIILFFGMYHPLHLGVIHIEVDGTGKALVQVRVFTDDLENAIAHKTGKPISINYTDTAVRRTANDYILSHLKVQQPGTGKLMKLQAMTRDKDITAFQYSATFNQNKSLNICCDIFFEVFRDQNNLLILNTPDEEKGVRLTHKKPCIELDK